MKNSNQPQNSNSMPNSNQPQNSNSMPNSNQPHLSIAQQCDILQTIGNIMYYPGIEKRGDIKLKSATINNIRTLFISICNDIFVTYIPQLESYIVSGEMPITTNEQPTDDLDYPKYNLDINVLQRVQKSHTVQINDSDNIIEDVELAIIKYSTDLIMAVDKQLSELPTKQYQTMLDDLIDSNNFEALDAISHITNNKI